MDGRRSRSTAPGCSTRATSVATQAKRRRRSCAAFAASTTMTARLRGRTCACSTRKVSNDSDGHTALHVPHGVSGQLPAHERRSQPPFSSMPFLRIHCSTHDDDVQLHSAFVRLSRDDCLHPPPHRINLAACVHVGDAEYYHLLQELCERNRSSNHQTPTEATASPSLHERPTGGGALPVAPSASTLPKRIPVLYELLTDHKNNTWTDELGRVRVRDDVQLGADQRLRQLASSLGVSAQMDVLDVRRRQWFLGDVSSEQLAADLERAAAPLRRRYLGALFASAIGTVGFGAASGGWTVLRTCAWLIPCPEAALLLLDWLQRGGDGRPAAVLAAMVRALLRLDVRSLRRLAFMQLVDAGLDDGNTFGIAVGGEASPSGGGSGDDRGGRRRGGELRRNDIEARRRVVTIARRNDAALNALDKLTGQAAGGGGAVRMEREVSLLYGAAHMADLSRRLVRERSFSVDQVQWLTVLGTADQHEDIPRRQRRRARRWRWPRLTAWAGGTVLVVAWLAISAGDYTGSVWNIAGDFGANGRSVPNELAEASLEFVLYVVRHTVVYYAVTRWLVDWKTPLFAVEQNLNETVGNEE